jgi:ABC-type uncharacterized transport system fused permease/ATPase subunit
VREKIGRRNTVSRLAEFKPAQRDPTTDKIFVVTQKILFDAKNSEPIVDPELGFSWLLWQRTRFLLSLAPRYAFVIAFLLLLFHALLSYVTSVLIPDSLGQLFAYILAIDQIWVEKRLLQLLYEVAIGGFCFGAICGLGQYFALQWRAGITEHLHQLLFTSNNLYNLECVQKKNDNYDQRLSDSCRNFTTGFAGATFGSTAHQISNSFIGTIATIGWCLYTTPLSPPLFYFIGGYLILFSFCLFPQFSLISSLQYQLNQYEGSFRYSQAKLRIFCESVTFYGGEVKERLNSLDLFANVFHSLQNFWFRLSILQVTAHVFIAINFANYSGLSTVAAFGVIMSAGVTGLSVEDLITLLLQYTIMFRALAALPQYGSQLAPVCGDGHRVSQLIELLSSSVRPSNEVLSSVISTEKFASPATTAILPVHASSSAPRPVLQLLNVSISTPRPTVLIRGLNLSVFPNSSICIRGTNASGKSSIIRAVAGLWDNYITGQIMKPSGVDRCGLYCLPQTCYTTLGSLLEQVIYPDTLVSPDVPASATVRELTAQLEEEARACLCAVRLDRILALFGLSSVQKWDDVLSGGEKQRLGVARVLFHRPCAAVLDECTSALDEATEAVCLQALASTGAGLLHIGNRPSLSARATRVFQLSIVKTMNNSFNYNLNMSSNKDMTSAAKVIMSEVKSDGLVEVASIPPPPTFVSAENSVGTSNSCEERSKLPAAPPCASIEDKSPSFLSRLFKLSRIAFPDCGKESTAAAVGGIFCHLCTGLCLYELNSQASFLIQLLLTTPLDLLVVYWTLAELLGFVLLANLFNFGGLWLGRKAAGHFRRTLLFHLFEYYFQNKMLYTINSFTSLDNIDGRLTADIDLLCSSWATFFYGDGNIMSWSGGFFNLLGVYLVFVCGALYWGYYLDVALAHAFCLLTCSLIIPVLQWVSRLAYYRQAAEATFRNFHTYTRRYAESLTVLSGQPAELRAATKAFKEFYKVAAQWVFGLSICVQANSLFLFLGQYFFAVWFAWLAVIYTPFLTGDAIFDSNSLNHRLGIVTTFVRVFQTLPYLLGRATELSAVISRVSEVLESFENLTAQKILRQTLGAQNIQTHDSMIIAEAVCASVPLSQGGSPLFRDLNFEIRQGQSTVIIGSSGSGKSSLLRVIAGLWEVQSGTIMRPDSIGRGAMLFLPQKPYMPYGSLKDQVLYPFAALEVDVDDSTLIEHLRFVGLETEVEIYGLHSVHNWLDILSAGQMQRLGFVRLFFHLPRFALLDEATSALDEESEALLMRRCLDLGITLVSVAHRPAVIAFHQQVLRLDGCGGCFMTPVNKAVTDIRMD